MTYVTKKTLDSDGRWYIVEITLTKEDTMRRIIDTLIGHTLRITGCRFRFSKDHRWGTTRFHAAIYCMVDTIGANWTADGFNW